MSGRYETTGRTRLRVKRSWWRNLLVVQVEVTHTEHGDPWWRDASLEDFGLPDLPGIVRRDLPRGPPPNQGSGGFRPGSRYRDRDELPPFPTGGSIFEDKRRRPPAPEGD